MRNYFFIAILIVSSLASNAQHAQEALRQHELEMKYALDSLRLSKNDKTREKWNEKFKQLVADALEMSEVFDYPFDSLKSIAKLKSPDNKFRIFNWNIENNNGTFSYYAFVLIPDNQQKVFELIDQSDKIADPQSKTLDHKKWYGALYYDIIISTSNGRSEYTLLGWDGNNRSTHKKLIDVMVISKDKLQFGAPIFRDEKNSWNRRVIFEFSSQASLVMHYNEKTQIIVFDHLSPETPAAEGIFEFYFPDGSYDGYHLENGKWLYTKDVDARREKDKRDRNFSKPENDLPPRH